MLVVQPSLMMKKPEIIRATYARYRFRARILERVIRRHYKICISHNCIQMYLKDQGLAQDRKEAEKQEVAGFGRCMDESSKYAIT